MRSFTQLQLTLSSYGPSHRTCYSPRGSHLRDRRWEIGGITLHQAQVENPQGNCRTYCVAKVGPSPLKVEELGLASSPAHGFSGRWKNRLYTEMSQNVLIKRSLNIEHFLCLPVLKDELVNLYYRGLTFTVYKEFLEINKKMANN